MTISTGRLRRARFQKQTSGATLLQTTTSQKTGA